MRVMCVFSPVNAEINLMVTETSVDDGDSSPKMRVWTAWDPIPGSALNHTPHPGSLGS